MSLVRRACAGALAGAAGTAAMDRVLYARYRRDGGKDSFWQWEFASGVTTWHDASAPGQVGRKVERLVTHQPPPDSWGASHNERRALGHRHRLGRSVRHLGQ